MRACLLLGLVISLIGCQKSNDAPQAEGANLSPAAGSGKEVPLTKASEDLIRQASQLIEQHDLDGALTLLNQAVTGEPNHPEVYFRRAGVHADKNDDAAAEGDYNKAVELAPRIAKYWNTRGFYHLSRQKHQQAERDFQQAIEIDPRYKQALNNQALVFISRGEFDQAIDLLKRALEIDPKYTDASNNLGYAYLQKGLMFKALEQFDQVIEIDPNYVNAYNNRGLVKHRLMKHNEAVTDFTEAIVRDPENLKFYHQRRDAYLALQMMDEARRDDEKVRWLLGLGEHHRLVRVKPQDPAVYIDRALYYSSVDLHQEAIDDLNRALQLDERNVKALLRRGEIWMEMKRYDQVIGDCTRILEIEPLRNAYSLRGDAYLQLGDLDHAVSDYEQSQRFDADVAHAFWMRAERLEKSGNIEAATEDRLRAREIDPTLAERPADQPAE